MALPHATDVIFITQTPLMTIRAFEVMARPITEYWSSHDVLPHQNWHDDKIASPWGAHSSVLEAPVTGSIPFEVASNGLAGKSLNASRVALPLDPQPVPSTQGTTTQYAPTFSSGAKVPVPSQYYPATLSGSSKPVISELQGTSSQIAPASLDAKVPVFSQAAPSGFSLSMSSQLKPSTLRWSQGFQASGTVAAQGFQTSGTTTSQNNTPSQGSKSPSRFSTLYNQQQVLANFFSTQEVADIVVCSASLKVPLASMPLLLWMQRCQCTVRLLQVDFPCLRASLPPLGGPKVFRPLVQWHHRVALHLKTLSLPVGSLLLPQQRVLANFYPHRMEVADMVACPVSKQSTSGQSYSPQFSSGSSFMTALSLPVDSVAQSCFRLLSVDKCLLVCLVLFNTPDSTTYGQKPFQSSPTSG
ncbi:unnamed protein product [Leuciscus chuanchicus]